MVHLYIYSIEMMYYIGQIEQLHECDVYNVQHSQNIPKPKDT